MCQRDPRVLLIPVLSVVYKGIVLREERSGRLDVAERFMIIVGFQTAQES